MVGPQNIGQSKNKRKPLKICKAYCIFTLANNSKILVQSCSAASPDVLIFYLFFFPQKIFPKNIWMSANKTIGLGTLICGGAHQTDAKQLASPVFSMQESTTLHWQTGHLCLLLQLHFFFYCVLPRREQEALQDVPNPAIATGQWQSLLPPSGLCCPVANARETDNIHLPGWPCRLKDLGPQHCCHCTGTRRKTAVGRKPL